MGTRDPVRCVTAARVLHDDDESTGGEPSEERVARAGIFRVWRALEQGGQPRSRVRPVNVSTQDDAIAHPRLDVLVDPDRGALRLRDRHRRGGGRQRDREPATRIHFSTRKKSVEFRRDQKCGSERP